jgi:adenylate cyclase
MNRGHFDLALGQVERALEINPSDAKSLAMRGAILMWAGRPSEALPWTQEALRLDPTDARTAFYAGVIDYFLAQYSEAVPALDRALGRNTQLMGRCILAATYAQLQRQQYAERERAAVVRIVPFLDAKRFASQFGAQEARDHMLDGLTKAGFH